jgi:predicted ATP-dependent endonuclease of OLD family
MLLKKVKIYNYRQLQEVELDLQNSLTVLAGPNNSGKTTLISILKGIFHDKKLSFTMAIMLPLYTIIEICRE